MVRPAKSDEFPIEEQQYTMRIGVTQAMVQPGFREGCFVLRIGNRTAPSKFGEFFAASPADSLDQIAVPVTREIQERRSLPILLAHEKERNKRREQGHPRGQLLRLEFNERAQPLPACAIAHLIV